METDRLAQQYRELQTAGIMTGYSDGSPGFSQIASRAELAAIAARIGGQTAASGSQPEPASFQDVRPEHWFYGWVESAHRLGVMQGKGDGIFDPNGKITVEEAVIVMAKLLRLPEADGPALPQASPWAQGWIRAMMNAQLIERDTQRDYTEEMSRSELIGLIYLAYTDEGPKHN